MIVELNYQNKRTLSAVEYSCELAKSGIRIIPGLEGTFWVRYEFGTMMRMPTFNITLPDPDEIRRVLWRGPAFSISCIQDPDKSHSANSWLYICKDNSYAIEKLSSAMRRNVRRGLNELRIEPINSAKLLAHGVRAFCDTRRRVGLSDGTPDEFTKRFTLRSRCPGHVYFGAWRGEQLAAFLSITEVDDWAEIEGCFSRNDLLKYRPNDTLMFSMLQHYLTVRKYSAVSYGLSSIQAKSNEAGLHAFKTKVGFEARPVHRQFIIHPFLRPFVNSLTLMGVSTALRLSPGNRLLKKASGVLVLLLSKHNESTDIRGE